MAKRQALPIKPVGKYILLQLDRNRNLRGASIVALGTAIPRGYYLKVGQRVSISKDYVVEEYTINQDDEDYDLDFALIHLDGILGVVDQK